MKVITQMTLWIPIRPWAEEHLTGLIWQHPETALQPCVRNPYTEEFYGKSKTTKKKCSCIRPLSLTGHIICIQIVPKSAFKG